MSRHGVVPRDDGNAYEIETPTPTGSRTVLMNMEDFAEIPLLKSELETLDMAPLLAALIVNHPSTPSHILVVNAGVATTGRLGFQLLATQLIRAVHGKIDFESIANGCRVEIAQAVVPRQEQYTHIVCYELDDICQEKNMRRWAARWTESLAPGGRFVIELRWAKEDKSWPDVAYRYATMATEFGLRLKCVNGCSVGCGAVRETGFGHAVAAAIAGQYDDIADRLGRIGAMMPKLQLELKWQAARLRQNVTVDNIIALGGHMYGTFERL